MKRVRPLALLKETFDRFTDYGDLLAAGMSFYTLLSVAPLVVMSVNVAGWVFGADHARSSLRTLFARMHSPKLEQTAASLMDAADHDSATVASLIAGLTLLWAASRLFLQMQDALNLLWGVRAAPAKSARGAIARVAIKRLVSFAMVLGCGALLLITIALQTVTVSLGQVIERYFGVSAFTSAVALLQQTALSIALSSLLFAVIYRVLPDVRLRWADVWIGALLTATLMLAGTWLLGLYLSKIAPAWLEGAIGSIAVFMVWAYYQAQVFLLGAAFTRAWSARNDHLPEPEPHAEVVPELEAATAAMPSDAAAPHL